MKNNFNSWCKDNSGYIAFWGIILAPLINTAYQVILGHLSLNTFLSFTKYKISIPLGIFFLIGILSIVFYFLKPMLFAKSYVSFLKGQWKNEWTIGEVTNSEICDIKKNGDYYIANNHHYELKGYFYDKSGQNIVFSKNAIKSGDTRKMHNFLHIENNDVLSGWEDGYRIQYTRLKNIIN